MAKGKGNKGKGSQESRSGSRQGAQTPSRSQESPRPSEQQSEDPEEIASVTASQQGEDNISEVTASETGSQQGDDDREFTAYYPSRQARREAERQDQHQQQPNFQQQSHIRGGTYQQRGAQHQQPSYFQQQSDIRGIRFPHRQEQPRGAQHQPNFQQQPHIPRGETRAPFPSHSGNRPGGGGSSSSSARSFGGVGTSAFSSGSRPGPVQSRVPCAYCNQYGHERGSCELLQKREQERKGKQQVLATPINRRRIEDVGDGPGASSVRSYAGAARAFEPGPSDGQAGGRSGHYDDGETRDPSGSSPSVTDLRLDDNPIDALSQFVRRRLINCIRIHSENDVRERDSNRDNKRQQIENELRPYLEFHRGIDALLPKKRKPNDHDRPNIDCKIYANHFKMAWQPNARFNTFIILYKITWTNGKKLSREDKMDLWSQVWAEFGTNPAYFNSTDHRISPLYEGGSLLISPFAFGFNRVELASPDGKTFSMVSGQEVNIKHKETLDKQTLDQYQQGHLRYVEFPQAINWVANRIMKEYCISKEYIESGRYYFLDDVHEDPDTIRGNQMGDLLRRRQGYFQSVRVLEGGLTLNVDIMSTAFYHPNMKLDIAWRRMLAGPYLPEEKKRCFRAPDYSFDAAQYAEQVGIANECLKNLKISSTHRQYLQNGGEPTRYFSINKVESKPADTQKVVLHWGVGGHSSGTNLPLISFMRNAYRWNNTEPLGHDWPALKVSKKYDQYLPWGCCSTTGASRFPGKLDFRYQENLKWTVEDRYIHIKRWKVDLNNGNRFVSDPETNFGIGVERDLLEVNSLKLPQPEIVYPRASHPEPKFWVSARVELWGILSFNDQQHKTTEDNYLSKLKRKGQQLGMEWRSNPTFWERFNADEHSSSANRRTTLINYVRTVMARFANLQTAPAGTPQPALGLIVCLMTKKMTPEYGTLKFLFDKTYGIPSQVIVVKLPNDNTRRRPDNFPPDVLIFNLLLKINVKCCGQNFRPPERMRNLPLMQEDQHTILMGADVTHPGIDDNRYSISAVVATTDRYKVNYACRLKALGKGQEMIDLEGMVEDLLRVYQRNEGRFPENILFFRDGVSEAQFLTCLRYEGTAILQIAKRLAAEQEGYKPKVVIILAVKRHHTRFFVFKTGREGQIMGPATNLDAGSVVISGVTYVLEYDFFLCSHRNITTSTSHPTHYIVLLDQIDLDPYNLYELVFYLCHTFQRCTKPVSLVTPVYYAHLAAFRAKLYMEYYLLQYPGPDELPPQKDLDFNAHSALRDRLWFL